MMKCNDVRELLLALLDGEATSDERASVEAHLAACEACRRERDDLAQTRAVIGTVLASRALPLDFAKKTAEKALPPKRGRNMWEWNTRVYLMKWVVAAAILLGFAAILPMKLTPPPNGAVCERLEIRVFTQQSFLAGSRASVRVIARDWKEETPISEADVEMKLVSIDRVDIKVKSPQAVDRLLARGRTDADGTISVDFVLPDLPEGIYAMDVKTTAGGKTAKVWYPIEVRRATAIYLTTDKPLYQPAQVIHVRALAVRKSDLHPIGASAITLEIEDPKGNKILKALGRTSEFGIAETTFTLGDEINLGSYVVRAILEEGGKTETTQKNVTVDRYSLPHFKIVAKADKEYYHPQEKVKLHIQSDYFYGKPVADAEIEVVGTTLEAGLHEFFRGTAKTDATGACEFPEVQLPDYFVGQPLLQGKGVAQFEVKLTDPGKQIESTRVVTTVSEGDVQVTAFPEGGTLMPGLSNTIWVAANYPDGTPAQAHVVATLADGSTREVDTDELGLGTFEFTPAAGQAAVKASLAAKDAKGHEGKGTADLAEQGGDHGLRVLLDKGIYRVGETVHIGVMSTTANGTVFVDVVRNGQTALTRSVDLKGGKGSLDVELPNDLFGVVEVSAYEVKKSLNIVRDTRKAFVSPAEDLRIAIGLDKETYRPGEQATLDVSVTDANGRPVLAALGVWVVDPAVLARAEIAPGLEKVFFLLEKELLKPRYEIHGLSADKVLVDETAKNRDRAAKALFAASDTIEHLPVRVSSRDEAIKAEVKEDAEAIAKAAKGYVARERERLHEKRIIEDWKRVLGAVQKATDDGKLHPELKAMTESYERIWTGIQKYWTLGKPQLDATLDGLVREGVLTRAQMSDEWGTQFHCDPSFCGCAANAYPHELHLVSAGPDKKYGTPDDQTMLVGHVMQQGAPAGTVEDLVKLGYLKPAEAKDPWGNDYIGAIYGPNQVTGNWSAGPDGKAGTADDLFINGEQIAGAFLQTAPVERFAEMGLCLKDATIDPYGEPYAKVVAYGGWETGVVLQSAGADGKADDTDDLVSTAVTEGTGTYKVAFGYVGDVTRNRQLKWREGEGVADEPALALGLLENGVRRGEVFDGFERLRGGVGGDLGVIDGIDRDETVVLLARVNTGFSVDRDINEDGVFGGMVNNTGVIEAKGHAAQITLSGGIDIDSADDMNVLYYSGSVSAVPSHEMNIRRVGDGPRARLRQYFPETLFVAPEVVTDANGHAKLHVGLADTITRWEASAFANSLDGRMGSTSKQIPVFQEFFLDAGLPPYLTQNDTVTIPVSVMNYGKEVQDVTVTLKRDDWYESKDVYEKVVRIEPGKVGGVQFTLHAKTVGVHGLRIDAKSSSLADAVLRPIEVIPDGREVAWSASDRLEGKKAHRFEVPDGAVDGSPGLVVRVFPGIFAQVVDGMDSMLVMPGG